MSFDLDPTQLERVIQLLEHARWSMQFNFIVNEHDRIITTMPADERGTREGQAIVHAVNNWADLAKLRAERDALRVRVGEVEQERDMARKALRDLLFFLDRDDGSRLPESFMWNEAFEAAHAVLGKDGVLTTPTPGSFDNAAMTTPSRDAEAVLAEAERENWGYEDVGASCGYACTPNGCPETHPSGEAWLQGPTYVFPSGYTVDDNPNDRVFKIEEAAAIVLAVNAHARLTREHREQGEKLAAAQSALRLVADDADDGDFAEARRLYLRSAEEPCECDRVDASGHGSCGSCDDFAHAERIMDRLQEQARAALRAIEAVKGRERLTTFGQ